MSHCEFIDCSWKEWRNSARRIVLDFDSGTERQLGRLGRTLASTNGALSTIIIHPWLNLRYEQCDE